MAPVRLSAQPRGECSDVQVVGVLDDTQSCLIEEDGDVQARERFPRLRHSRVHAIEPDGGIVFGNRLDVFVSVWGEVYLASKRKGSGVGVYGLRGQTPAVPALTVLSTLVVFVGSC